MMIGVPKEIKPQENRVGLVPASVREIVRAGGSVFIEKNAGKGVGITDLEYKAAGATILEQASAIYEKADLIIKVKEPQPIECQYLRKGQTLFTFLHLAADLGLTKRLKKAGVMAIAYETVTHHDGGLPLLTPMSQIAGRMSIQAGAHCLESTHGGRGVLLSGVAGVPANHVVIVGAGMVGGNALRMAVGMEAQVTVLDKSLPRLNELSAQFGSKINAVYATHEALEYYVAVADLVIGAVLVPGAAAPKVITRAMVQSMRPGSVVVDVAIDQGGCFETSKPTTLQSPIFIVDGILHYCVTNMPGAVPRTSTFALNNATLPYVLKLVTQGIKPALLSDPHFLNGLNIYQGAITQQAVARELNDEYVVAKDALML